MKSKENGNFICVLPKRKLQDVYKKRGLSPCKTEAYLGASLIMNVKDADEFLFEAVKTNDIGNSIFTLPKKDLQDLCRKHGLSPYMTKPNLVNCLIDYVKETERLSLRERKMKQSANSIGSLPKKKLQDLCKNYGLSPYKTKPDLVSSLITYYSKIADIETSEGIGYDILDEVPRNAIGERVSSGLPEKRFKQGVIPQISVTNNAHVPSVEFSVSSEDGINLFVDLNSCPSDWFKRLEKEACVCQNLQNHKFRSFRQELQFVGNNRQMTENTDDASLGVSATTESGDGSVEYFTSSEGKKGSPPTSGTMCGGRNVNITDISNLTEEKEIKLLGMTTSPALEEIVAINKPVDVVADNPESTTEALDVRQCSYESLEKITVSSPEDMTELKQNKDESQKTILYDVSCVNSGRQRTCAPENLIELAHLSSETYFTETEASDIGSHQPTSCSSEKDWFRNLVDAADSFRSRLPNSCEASCSIFLDDRPSSTNRGERDSHGNGVEASGELFKKQDEHLPHKEKKRKKHDGSNNIHHNNEGRILRSASRLQSLPRRSMRLVAK